MWAWVLEDNGLATLIPASHEYVSMSGCPTSAEGSPAVQDGPRMPRRLDATGERLRLVPALSDGDHGVVICGSE